MYELDSMLISGWISSSVLPFFRIGAFFMASPIFGTQLIAARTRIVIAFLTTLLLVPNLPAMPAVDALSIQALILVSQQIIIGVAMGVAMQVFLQLFVVAGQLIAMHMGLGFASMVDPSNGVSVTVLSQFHLMLVTLVFVSMNGHLAMIEIMAESFYALPVGTAFLTNNAMLALASSGSWMFASALLMALPAVAALMVINLSLGIVTRAAPQLNIFALGFPSMLILGLWIILITMNGYVPLFDRFTQEALQFMSSLMYR
jgi:flagellar biosynthetic protein FliR